MGYALYGLTVMVIVMSVGWIETAPGDTEPPKGTLAKLSVANLRSFGNLATAQWDRWLGDSDGGLPEFDRNGRPPFVLKIPSNNNDLTVHGRFWDCRLTDYDQQELEIVWDRDFYD